MEEFQCKTTIYSGPGAVSALAGMGGERLMLVTDPFFMKNGTAQRIARTAKCAQVEFFDKVQPDPSVELAAEAAGLKRGEFVRVTGSIEAVNKGYFVIGKLEELTRITEDEMFPLRDKFQK